MVILLSDRKNKCEKEIIEILTKYGAQHISDRFIGADDGAFTILSVYKKSVFEIKKGIVVFLDSSSRFEEQTLPIGLVGICEEKNLKALETFKKNKIEVISCGINNKNSITLSSFGSNNLFTCLQRSLQNQNGSIIEQGEFKIELTKPYLPFSVMASAAILLLEGKKPLNF